MAAREKVVDDAFSRALILVTELWFVVLLCCGSRVVSWAAVEQRLTLRLELCFQRSTE